VIREARRGMLCIDLFIVVSRAGSCTSHRPVLPVTGVCSPPVGSMYSLRSPLHSLRCVLLSSDVHSRGGIVGETCRHALMNVSLWMLHRDVDVGRWGIALGRRRPPGALRRCSLSVYSGSMSPCRHLTGAWRFSDPPLRGMPVQCALHWPLARVMLRQWQLY